VQRGKVRFFSHQTGGVRQAEVRRVASWTGMALLGRVRRGRVWFFFKQQASHKYKQEWIGAGRLGSHRLGMA
jgi:hypothetical protein